MKSLRKISLLSESSFERAFSTDEIKIFKILNRELENLSTKDKMVDFIKKLLGYLGFDPSEAMYYYYLYNFNYRKDGKYEEIKKGEERSLQDLKGIKTPNYLMKNFAKSKIPFKGNNIEGFWETDPNNEKQFVITSYNWYPVYIYKNNKWYKVSDSYSVSTSKQMSQTGIWSKVMEVLSPKDMNQLRNGIPIEKLQKDKVKDLYEFLDNRFKNRPYHFVTINIPNRIGDEILPSNHIRIKFGVNYTDQVNGKIVMDVDVTDIDFVGYDNKLIPSQTQQHSEEFKDMIPNVLKSEIVNRKLPVDLMRLGDELIDLNVDFKF